MTPLDKLRFAAIASLTVIGVGILAFLLRMVWQIGALDAATAGWATAGFLALREVLSKLENIVNGPASPLPEESQ